MKKVDYRQTEEYKAIRSSYDACSVVEGFCEGTPTPQQYLAAFQYLVDTGDAWRLQGWYGRKAAGLIEEGIIKSKAVK